MTPTVIVLTIVAGGVGAVTRHLLDTSVSARLGDDYPWGVFVVNLTGAFALGVLTALVARGRLADATLAVVGVGLTGGYTTFSTTSVDTVRLALAGRHRAAVANGAAQIVACVLAAGLGLSTGRLWSW